MQQAYPPYAPQPSAGHSSHSTSGSCGCGDSAGAAQTPYYPNHDQNQYQYYTADQYPEYYQGYQASAMPGTLASWFDLSNQSYLKGLIAGAGITFLLTNPAMKRSIIKGVVGLTSAVQGGVEEVKEQVQDIKAEMGQKEG